jgi:hypothetical protein
MASLRAAAVVRRDSAFHAQDPIPTISTATLRDGLCAAGYTPGAGALAVLRSAFRLRQAGEAPRGGGSGSGAAIIAVLPLAVLLVGDAAHSDAVLMHVEALAAQRSGRGGGASGAWQ